MRWPWVSRARLEAALAELDRADERHAAELNRERARADRLQEELVAMARRQTGLPQHKEKKPKDPIPPEVRDLIGAWDSEHIRAHLSREVRQARRDGVPWKEIERRLAEDAVPA